MNHIDRQFFIQTPQSRLIDNWRGNSMSLVLSECEGVTYDRNVVEHL